MKSILLFFALLSLNFHVNASCLSGLISAFPAENELAENSWIVLELYGMGQDLIPENFDGKEIPGVYLKSGSKRLRLELVQPYSLLKGVHTTTITLKPKQKLKLGLSYDLIIENLPKGVWKFQKTWTVTRPADYASPEILTQPIETSKSYQALGCGPEKWVYFIFNGRDTSSILVKFVLRDENGKVQGENLIFTKTNHSFKIGNGMCSGNTSVKDGKSYTLEVFFLDICGNISAQKMETITFVSPTWEDQESNKKNPQVKID